MSWNPRREKLGPQEQAYYKQIAWDFEIEKKQTLDQLKAETARAKLEAHARELAGPERAAFHRTRKSGLGGKGARVLRAIVGPSVFDRAEQRYGTDFLRVAGQKIEKIRRMTESKRAARLELLKRRLAKKGWTKEEIARFRERAFKTYRLPRISHSPIRHGKFKGMYEEKIRVRRAHPIEGKSNFIYKRTRILKTKSAVFAVQRGLRRLGYIMTVADNLQISLTEARMLVRETEAHARTEYKKYRASAEFAKLTPRQRHAATMQRWQGGAIAALFALMDIEAYITTA
jgi:hypothetical protein